MSRITDFLFGTSEFLLPEETGGESARAMERLMLLGVEYRGAKKLSLPSAGAGEEEKRALFCVLRRRDEKKAAAAFQDAGLHFTVRRRGLPHLVCRYRRRPGLLLGLILFFFLVFASENFIFDIRVSGNETLTDGEVLAMLEEDGVKIGGYLPALDLDGICVQFVRRHGEVSWITVNMMGTVAEVELREYAPGGDTSGSPEGDAERSLKALVAKRDGVVERCEVYGGSSLVQPMQVVRKGELLISCVVQTERRFRLEDAEGLVFAKTNRTLTVEIPEKETVTLPKETESTLTGVEILGVNISFPGREELFSSDDGSDTKIIEEKERFVLFGKLPLPIFLLSARRDEQEERIVERTGEQLREEANARMAQLVEKELAGADLLSSDLEYTDTGDGCRLTLTAECLENIAVPLEVKSDVRVSPGETKEK